MAKDQEGSKIQKIIKGPSLGYTDNLSKREMWEEIAKELNGEFKIKHDAGHAIEIHHISIPYKKWIIMISVSDSRPLKVVINFSSGQDFKFVMSRMDFIEKMAGIFRRPGIKLGWNEFDKGYLIKSKRPDLVKKIISKEIQKAILKYNIYSISYHTDRKTNTAELTSVIQRQAGNKEMNVGLIEMYKSLLANLEISRIIK